MLTVHGTVLEFRATGEQVPVANLRLKVRSSGGGGAVLATPLADTVTDEHGRYSIDIDCNPGCAVYFQPDPQSEYRFLCDWYPIPVRYFPGHSPLFYLPVVHKTWSGDRPPSGMLIFSGAWGIVSEQIAGSLQPVAGATVTLDGARGDPPATTGPNGFFMICAMVGGGQGPRTLAAFKTGYNPVTREIEEEAGSDDVRLLLTRK